MSKCQALLWACTDFFKMADRDRRKLPVPSLEDSLGKLFGVLLSISSTWLSFVTDFSARVSLQKEQLALS